MIKLEKCIDQQHPVIAGHFPGHPVVPGALILECVFSSILESYPDVSNIDRLVQVKFITPVLPDQLFNIILEKKDNNRIIFKLTISSHDYVKGVIGYRSHDS